MNELQKASDLVNAPDKKVTSGKRWGLFVLLSFLIVYPLVIPPFSVLTRSRGQAARANFCLGVMPPRAIFGRS